MADVSSLIFFGLFRHIQFFSLDPGDRADEQLVEPALGRHNLPHGLGRQAICLQAADQADALLPRPLCFQMPYNCHLLHLHEGIFGKSLFGSSLFCHCQDWAILVAIVPLVSFNMWLTRHTYTLPTNPGRQDHLRFCTVVGGM